ncbi:PREDICTED: glutamate receptor ionotropic, delta-1-like [Polistes dominula]|uniref:Glutamate receptor ionotropic, delta-1-like n=1 Tax=Polistes dominula TaxID=743375 RepID=A0ABM1JDM2_POLDO|nr:PREDICTED: glutamate receptor ionotropic, delta-1-like [Polistes dominula]
MILLFVQTILPEKFLTIHFHTLKIHFIYNIVHGVLRTRSKFIMSSLLVFLFTYLFFLSYVVCFFNSRTFSSDRFLAENYVSNVIEICHFYKASSVFLFYTAAYIRDLKVNTMVQTWARLLSREKISFINIHLSNMTKTSCYLYRIRKPLFVVILIDDQSVVEFSKESRIFNMSFPVWYVIFLPGNYRQNYCQERSKNLFNIHFNTDMLVTCPPDNVMREWYSLKDNETKTSDLAILKPDGSFQFLTNLTKYHRRRNLNGLKLRTVIVKDSPYVEVEKNGKLNGLFGDIITEISQAANFTFNIVEFVKEYGRWDDDNQIWTGAVGEIVAGRADIAIGEFSLTTSRLNVVDYVLPVLVSHMNFYIKDPLYDNVKWTGYFKVFDSKIWIFIIVIISTAPSLVSVLKMNDIQECNIYQIISMILENYLQCWGIFCQQGLNGFSYRLSLRLAYFSTFLSAFVVFTAYSGTLVSFITNSIHSLPFRTLEELVKDGTYQLAVYRGGSEYDMFAYGNDSTSKKIMKIMRKENELPTTALEALLLVCKSKRRVTFFTSVDIKLSIRNHSLCNLITINGGHINTLSMILTKNNPFVDLINHHLRQFLFNGVIDRLIKKNRKNFNSHGLTYKSVSLHSVNPIFDLLKIVDVKNVKRSNRIMFECIRVCLLGYTCSAGKITSTRSWELSRS